MAISRRADVFKLQGHTLDSKFRVERVVAEGGFAVVYQARHVMLDRPVALKVLRTPTHLDGPGRAQFMDGFAREARAMVQINHPNIVQVLDFGVNEMPTGEQAPWMALEWCEGGTLRDALALRRGQGGRTPAEALALLRPALEALAYAHEESIAHRDLKPANMMVVSTRRGPTLKLLDFGVAKVMDDGEDTGTGHTQTHAAFQAYSLHYAAPEQIGGTRTGPWTDVHAMALILTEVLTDQPPYRGEDRTEICCEVLAPERPTPGARKVAVGPWEPILRRALALRPAERFKNAGELLAALEAALSAPGAGAAPVSSAFTMAPTQPALAAQSMAAVQPVATAQPASGVAAVAPAGAPAPGAGVMPLGAAPFGPPAMPPFAGPAPFVAPGNTPAPFGLQPNAFGAMPMPPPSVPEEPHVTTLRGAAAAVPIAPGARGAARWPLAVGGAIALVGLLGIVLALRSGGRANAAPVSTAAPPVQSVVVALPPPPIAPPPVAPAPIAPIAPAPIAPAQLPAVAPVPTATPTARTTHVSSSSARAPTATRPSTTRVRPATPPARPGGTDGHARVQID